MTVPEITYTIILIVAMVILFAIYIIAVIKSLRTSSTSRGFVVSALTVAFLLCAFLALNAHGMEPADLGQSLLTLSLVAITGFYAWRTHVMSKAAKEQADASITMAEEMKAQRRPIVVPKAFPAIGVPLQASVEDIAKHVYSDYFEIRNEGYGPAIELEILLLDKEKRQLEKQRETFFPKVSESPLEFHPNGLTNHVNSTCYLLCRYRGVISSDEAQLWYETWLPFVPVKSQRGDRIIIQPKELEFSETHKKESY